MLLLQHLVDTYNALPDLPSLFAADAIHDKVPHPGGGSAPPGSGGLLKILKWAAWVASAIAVLGVIVAGAMMAISSRRGEGGEHATRLGWVLGGAILISAAGPIVEALV